MLEPDFAPVASKLNSGQFLDRGAIQAISRVTWVGVALNVVLVAAKFLGGWWAGSQTLVADGIHSLSDLATDLVILVGVRFWTAPADAGHHYGHGKIETLVILAIGLALAGVGLGLVYGAIQVLSLAVVKPPTGPTASLPAIWTGLAVALASIVSKEWLYRWTVARGTALKSSALVANAWHHRSDALSSIPTTLTLGGWAMGAHQGWNPWFLDPVGTVVVAVMIIAAAWSVTKPTLATLLDASAGRRLSAAVRQSVAATPGVLSGHKLRTRFLGPGAAEVNLHILVDGGLTVAAGHHIAADVKYRLLALAVPGIRVVDVLVHIEPGPVACE